MFSTVIVTPACFELHRAALAPSSDSIRHLGVARVGAAYLAVLMAVTVRLVAVEGSRTA